MHKVEKIKKDIELDEIMLDRYNNGVLVLQ